MSPSREETLSTPLPDSVERTLGAFLKASQDAFGDNLLSIVLFGSAAEGALSPASDVNVLLVLKAFDPSQAEGLREALSAAEAAVRLKAMFLLVSEVEEAALAFAQKFADIQRRHRVLFGPDPFARLALSRRGVLFRLKQVLLNLELRLRESWVSEGDREERLWVILSDVAGPLRACAATLLELEGRRAPSARAALAEIAGAQEGEPPAQAVSLLSKVRREGSLPAGQAGPALLELMRLARRMRERAGKLS